jgi:hypothetical protein
MRGAAFADLPFDVVRRALARLRDAPTSDRATASRHLDEAIHGLSDLQADHTGAVRP